MLDKKLMDKETYFLIVEGRLKFFDSLEQIFDERLTPPPSILVAGVFTKSIFDRYIQ